MPNNRLTLGIGLLLGAGATLAHASYTVRKGDTLSEIAKRLHVSPVALRKANGLGAKNTLRIGMRLNVPSKGVAAKVSKKAPKMNGGDTYTVKPGDNDWTIASRTGIKIKQLHALNPGVAWTKIRPGAKLRLPSGLAVAATTPRLRSRAAIVTGENVTVRRLPGKGAPRVTTVDRGTRVAVLARDGGWYKLRFPKGSVGWVRGDLLKAAAPLPVAKAPVAKKVVHHETIVRYAAALKRKPAKRSSAWYKAHYENVARRKAAHQANVRARYVRRWNAKTRRYVVAPLVNGGDLIAKAESFKGVRYSWGRASRSGTDCSGFTTQVFRAEGVKLPRTSREQARVGNKVSRKEMSKGDLVFFATGRGRRVSHVGIYMGNGKFIHASSGGRKVQVSNLTGYYANRFVGARRVPTKAKAKKIEPKPVEATVAEVPAGE